MSPLIIAAIVSIVFFGLAVVILNRFTKRNTYAESMIDRMADERDGSQTPADSILRVDFSGNPALQTISRWPGGAAIGEKLLQAGLEHKASGFLVTSMILTITVPVAVYVFSGSFISAFLSFLVTIFIIRSWLLRQVKKRNDKFINDFPDTLDLIVRAVRSGFPINTSIGMIVDNMQPPISTEFRQVADEIALGRPLDDALTRLSQRINEPDVNFFVVVLKVQQETGGNLAEVVNNLSNVIRRRKQLRLKIRAMTSEGRTTGYILSALPIIVFAAIQLIAPEHFKPLFETSTGHMWLMISASLIVVTQIVVRKMTNIDI